MILNISRKIGMFCSRKLNARKRKYRMKIMKYIIRAGLILAISSLLGVMLLAAVYLIPQDKLRNNVIYSLTILHTEAYSEIVTDSGYGTPVEEEVAGRKPAGLASEMLQGIKSTKLDNFTDGFILNISYTQTGDAIRDALMGESTVAEGNDPVHWLYNVLWGKTDEYTYSPYTRYWHGYQIFTRPLLAFFNISSIRFFNMTVQLALMVLFVSVIIARKRCELILPFFVMWITLVPITLFYSLQYSSAFYVTMLTCLALAVRRDAGDIKHICIVFELDGILLAYFDFFTYPCVCLGIPLILLLSLDYDRVLSMCERIKQVFLLGLNWAFGYAGMWASKWLLVQIILGENAFSSAEAAIKNRSSNNVDGAVFTYADVLLENIRYYKNAVFALVFVIALAVALFMLFKYCRCRINKAVLAAIMLCAALPFAWYFVTMNHSMVHARFTFREFSMLFYALFSAICVNSAPNSIKEKAYG